MVGVIATLNLLGGAGCSTARFLSQAAVGQWKLSTQGRPLAEVIEDPDTPLETARLLREVRRIKGYGLAYGLDMGRNYDEFVQVDAPAVAWFVNACAPLAFEPLLISFPFFGSFPGTAWFDRAEADSVVAELRAEGWDVSIRGISAYSTGGWFDDPVVSSMFYDQPAALGFLVDTIFHESVHATVLVTNQQYFNESLASFVAEGLAPAYLTTYFGRDSMELAEYAAATQVSQLRHELLAEANRSLTLLYASALADAEKYAQKRRILAELSASVPFDDPPNNATLVGVQLYNEGSAEMERLWQRCGGWKRFLEATGSLGPEHFAEEQTPLIGPALDALTERDCRPYL